MSLGEKLQKLRKSKGLSQEQLAQDLQVSRQTISKWESDVNNPELEKLKEISVYFNITMDELLGLKEKDPNIVEEQSVFHEEVYEAKWKKQKHHMIVLVCLVVAMFLFSCISLTRLSSRIDALQENVRMLQANGNTHVFYDPQPNYSFLEDVQISYKDVNIEKNTVTQVIQFSLRTKKEGAHIWGEYRNKEQIEKEDAKENGSLSYTLEKEVELSDDITLMIFYEDEDGITSDFVTFDEGVKSDAIGSVNYLQDGVSRAGTDGDIATLNSTSNVSVRFMNTVYPFQMKSFDVIVYNHDKEIDRIPQTWEPYEPSGATDEFYQTISLDWEHTCEKNDDITLKVCVSDEQGMQICSRPFARYTYTKDTGVEMDYSF